jgi:hypothetical protein
MKHREIIDRMMSSIEVKSLAALARELEIAPSAINAAIRQKRLPDVWLYKVAYRTGRSVEWLQSGQGPEFTDVAAEESAHYQRTLPPALRMLLVRWKDLSDTQRSILEHATALLESEDKETRRTIRQVIERLYEHDEYQRQQRDSTPLKKEASSA